MKSSRFGAFPVLSLVLLGATFASPAIVPAQGAPRHLEIWPGQRVLMLLPTTLGSDWNAEPQLGQTLLPLMQRPLRDALARTEKFSITVPYRFDPILRRAVVDKRLADTDVDGLLTNPNLDSAQLVLGKFTFEQPAMILETRLEEVRVGGTPKAPTVQLQVSGRLFQVGNGAAAKSLTITSRSFGGSTSADRVQRAATQVFTELAQRLIEPPKSFNLPAPERPTPTSRTAPTTGTSGTVSTPNVTAPTPRVGELPRVSPVAPSGVTTQPPTSLSPIVGAPFVPQLPAAQPPLGIAVGETPSATQ